MELLLNLDEDHAKAIAGKMDEHGFEKNYKEPDFWEKELLERIDNPKEAEFVVRFGLEVVERECLDMEEKVARFFLSFVRACERYPAIHRVWINGIIKNWVKPLLRLANNEKKEKEIEVFFTTILSYCKPQNTLYDVCTFYAFKDAKSDEIMEYLYVLEMIFKKKLIIDLKKTSERKMYLLILECVEKQRMNVISRNGKRIFDYIDTIIWPKKVSEEILDHSVECIVRCDSLEMLEMIKRCNMINLQRIEAYIEVAQRIKNYCIIPQLILMKHETTGCHL